MTEWMISGVEFGIKAFSALFVFFGCWLVVILLLAAMSKVFGGRDDG